MTFLTQTRRQFLRLSLAAGSAALVGDAALLEPNRPRIVRRDIALKRWPERLQGFTVALLADFHYDPYFSIHPLRASIGMVNELRPDLILLAGDFVSVPFIGDEAKAALAAEPCARLLREMRAAYGLWAIMGNHDCSTDPKRVTGALQAEGIRVLANQSVAIERDGARFWLSGVDDVLSGGADLRKTLHDVPADEAVILAAHEPDFADYVVRRFPVDLQLSGHSHGGQVRLPLLPPLYLPRMAKKYVWGLHQVGALTLYTNAGLGTVAVPVRLNCPPEITLLTLRQSAPEQ
ncbi:MAG: metallophosphoesterase [Candidatus Sulfotelmatobacter sp.]